MKVVKCLLICLYCSLYAETSGFFLGGGFVYDNVKGVDVQNEKTQETQIQYKDTSTKKVVNTTKKITIPTPSTPQPQPYQPCGGGCNTSTGCGSSCYFVFSTTTTTHTTTTTTTHVQNVYQHTTTGAFRVVHQHYTGNIGLNFIFGYNHFFKNSRYGVQLIGGVADTNSVVPKTPLLNLLSVSLGINALIDFVDGMHETKNFTLIPLQLGLFIGCEGEENNYFLPLLGATKINMNVAVDFGLRARYNNQFWHLGASVPMIDQNVRITKTQSFEDGEENFILTFDYGYMF